MVHTFFIKESEGHLGWVASGLGPTQTKIKFSIAIPQSNSNELLKNELATK